MFPNAAQGDCPVPRWFSGRLFHRIMPYGCTVTTKPSLCDNQSGALTAWVSVRLASAKRFSKVAALAATASRIGVSIE